VVSIGTCPLCLPVGSITYLIDNGRQLELPLGERVVSTTIGDDTEMDRALQSAKSARDQSDHGLPF